jgi:hypothetical protein
LASIVLLSFLLSLGVLALPRPLDLRFDRQPDPAYVAGIDIEVTAAGGTVGRPGARNEIRLRTGPRPHLVRLHVAGDTPGQRVDVHVADTEMHATLSGKWEWLVLPVRVPPTRQPLRIRVRLPDGDAGATRLPVRVAAVEAVAGGRRALSPAGLKLAGWLALLLASSCVAAWLLAADSGALPGRGRGPWQAAVSALPPLASTAAVALGPPGLLWLIPGMATAAAALLFYLVALRHARQAEWHLDEVWRADRRRMGWFAVVAAVILAGFFSEAIFTGRVLSQADTLFRFYPWAAYAPAGFVHPGNPLLGDIPQIFHPWMISVRSALRDGDLPTWTPYMFGGHPLLGAAQSAVFSPFTLVGLLLPMPGATVWMAWARLFVAGLGMFVFLRGTGCRWPAAWLGGLLFLLNPFSVVWLEHPESAAMAWMPWLLWAGQRAATGGGRETAVLALAVALELTAGHPETSLKLFVFTGVYALACVWWTRREGASVRRAGQVVGAHLLGALVLAIQLLPFADYLLQSVVFSDRSATLQNPFTVPPVTVITALVPEFFGRMPGYSFNFDLTRTNPCEMQAYPGIVTWILAALAIVMARGERRVRFFATAGLLAALVMYGVPGFYHLASWLPLLRVTVLGRFGLVVITCAIVLAAFGLDALLRIGERETARRRLAALTARLATVGIVAAIVAALIWFWPALAGVRLVTITVVACAAALGFAVTGGYLVQGLAARSIPASVAFPALLAVSVADLFLSGYGFHPAIPARQVFPVLPEIARLQAETTPFRVGGWGSAFAPNAAQGYGLQDFRGYDGIWPRRYNDLLREAFGNEQPFQTAGDERAFRLLDLLNVRYVFATPEDHLPAGRFTRLPWGRAPLYRNEHSFPRAFLVGAFVVASADEALNLVRRPGLDLSKVVVLEQDLPAAARPSPASANHDSVRFSRYDDRAVAISVLAGDRRILVLGDRHDPGWTVTVDGEPAPLLRANYALRAVAVPQGRHEIVFKYEPRSVRVGAWISLAAFLVVLALALAGKTAASISSAERPEKEKEYVS